MFILEFKEQRHERRLLRIPNKESVEGFLPHLVEDVPCGDLYSYWVWKMPTGSATSLTLVDSKIGVTKTVIVETPSPRDYRYLVVVGMDEEEGPFRLEIDFQLLGNVTMVWPDGTSRFLGHFMKFEKRGEAFLEGEGSQRFDMTRVSTTFNKVDMYLDHGSVRTYS